MRKTAIAGVAVCLLLAGCQGGTPIEPVEVAPSAATFGEELAPVALDRVQFALRRGQVVGTYVNYGKLWAGCFSEVTDVVWAGTRETIQDEELEDIFYDELTAAGYEVVGNPDDLFADTADVRDEPEFLVGGRVDGLQMNVCNEWDGWRHTGAISGDAKMTVTWQVFSLLEGRVVHETTTDGYAKHEDGTLEGDYYLIADAFAAAAGNLAADSRFHELLAAIAVPAAVEPAVAAATPISVPVAPAFAGGVENNVDPIDRAVVTILLGNGHGSGFFITPTLLLTNHHVAGNRDRVRIRLSDGSETIGRVIRTDAARDVAIVEIEAPLATPLPLRASLPARAETVYAVGSPDDTGLAGTITRGIVSQIRTDERGLDWIQADVTVHAGSSGGPLLDAAGNVVGIAAWARVDAGGETKGLNFFVPLGDALRTLGIRLTGAAS
jgi:hypothetical protein